MNQPFTIPLFLPRTASDHSQVRRWRTASARPWTGRWHRSERPGTDIGTEHTAQATADPAPAAAPPARSTAASIRTTAGPQEDPVGGALTEGDRTRSRAVWAVVITGMALFMASLDNLVVSTALPVIREHLHAGLSGLEWTVNAYTLTFAVLMVTGGRLGDIFGRPGWRARTRRRRTGTSGRSR